MTQQDSSGYWERDSTTEEQQEIQKVIEEIRKEKREWRRRDIEKIQQGTYSLGGEVGELIGIAGFLTAVGIKLQPLFKTPGGRHFVGRISEGDSEIVDSVKEIDISKAGYSFQVYSIEEFLDL